MLTADLLLVDRRFSILPSSDSFTFLSVLKKKILVLAHCMPSLIVIKTCFAILAYLWVSRWYPLRSYIQNWCSLQLQHGSAGSFADSHSPLSRHRWLSCWAFRRLELVKTNHRCANSCRWAVLKSSEPEKYADSQADSALRHPLPPFKECPRVRESCPNY